MAQDPDIGLLALALVAKSLQINLDPETMAHDLGLGVRPAAPADLVKAARRAGLRAKLLSGQHASRLAEIPRPAIIRMTDGSYFILSKFPGAGGDALLDPLDIRARRVSMEELVREWNGEIILVTKRASIANES